MLFDTISESASIDLGNVQPCKYEANLEGALMLVYENECNYNSLMKAAGLSELKYYKETGGDLFVQEAGAFGGFLEKAKNFFKKVLEKIKALFKKFFMTITSFVQDDKTWAKKYEKDVLKASGYINDMEFKGYNFNNKILNDGFIDKSEVDSYAEKYLSPIADGYSLNDDGRSSNNSFYQNGKDLTEDDVNDIIEKNRGAFFDEKNTAYDSSEFRDRLKEVLYGDTEKDSIDGTDINLREQLTFISEASKSVRSAQKEEKYATRTITKIIKVLEAAEKEFRKTIKPGDDIYYIPKDRRKKDGGVDLSDETENKRRDIAIKSINQAIRVLQALSNDITVSNGIFCQALKDRNRQAKAICIKAVSYANKHKNESTIYYSDSDDLFSNVVIR